MKIFVPRLLAAVWACGMSALVSGAAAQQPDGRFTNYDQWKLSLERGVVADARAITALSGFQVELIRVAAADEGSWISLTFDPRGRLVIGREDRGMLRLTLADDRRFVSKVESIDDTLLECRGLLFAHGSLYASANNSKAFYRLRDTNDDDSFDRVDLLKEFPGGVGHGRNGLALGPDGMIYLVLGNNVQVPKGLETPLGPYAHFARDRLLPCAWNELLFDADVTPPAGYVARTDAEGRRWEIVAGGFRNPYSLAFNEDGELFTYDADMEWDIGAPWYRPTRVIHIVPGGEYGWRPGTSVWPDHFADMLPGVVDIGLGSPTGAKFGTPSHFPPPYRQALFILDWAYGRILAVHLAAKGATFAGRAETFLSGKPLNVTDLAFGPDGAMYFTVGGRRTQSALYRVQYSDPGTTANLAVAAGAAPAGGIPRQPSEQQRQQRLTLERLYGVADAGAVAAAWPYLDSDDRWLRQAARTVIELQPSETWQSRALGETASLGALTACLALARTAPAAARTPLLARLGEIARQELTTEQRLVALRAYELVFLRMGRPKAAEAARIGTSLERLYPAASFAENHLLSELLVYLGSPGVLEKSLDLLDAATSQEEQLWFLFVLRNVDQTWTIDQRRRYFAWLKRAESFQGVHSMKQFVTFIRTDALWSLSAAEQHNLAPLVGQLGIGNVETPTVVDRPFVRDWTSEELLPALADVGHDRNLSRGKAMFTQALCSHCHRIGGEGGQNGPDLSAVGFRYGRRDLLDSIVLPSKVIDGKYRDLRIETDDGRIFCGQIAGCDAESLAIAENSSRPTELTRVPRSSIVARTASAISSMPVGLLNTLSREEILDLLAYLQSGGKE
jgi:putative heme-binding domain-containing protein